MGQPVGVVSKYEDKAPADSIWDCYSKGLEILANGRVSSISVSGTYPYNYAIPNGQKVHIFRCSNDKLCRRLKGFDSRVSCCGFRGDGKLIAVGEESGFLRICSTDKNGFHLRKLQAHKGSVNSAHFFPGGLRAASIGSDGVVCIWDVALGTRINRYCSARTNESGKTLIPCRTDENILFCADLAGHVFVYDVRESKPVTTFKLPNGVSALASNNTDKVLAIANGSLIHFWTMEMRRFLSVPRSDESTADPFGGLRIHYKLVTGLCITNHPDTSQGEVLLSVSTDKVAKVSHLASFKELHQTRYLLPLTAVAATPDCATIIVGGEKGFVRAHHLNTESLTRLAMSDKSDHRADLTGNADPDFGSPGGLPSSYVKLADRFSGRWRGGNPLMSMTTDDWLEQPFDGPRKAPVKWIATDRASRFGHPVPLIHETSEISRDGFRFFSDSGSSDVLCKIDHMLKRFTHSQALSAVTRSRILTKQSGRVAPMAPHKHRLYAVAVIRELVRRGNLTAAVAGRDGVQLTRLLRFIRRNVWRCGCATACLELYHCILDIYTAEELSVIPEFFKTNEVLKRLSVNLHTVGAIADHIIDLTSDQITLKVAPKMPQIEPKDTNTSKCVTLKTKKLRKDSTVKSPF